MYCSPGSWIRAVIERIRIKIEKTGFRSGLLYLILIPPSSFGKISGSPSKQNNCIRIRPKISEPASLVCAHTWCMRCNGVKVSTHNTARICHLYTRSQWGGGTRVLCAQEVMSIRIWWVYYKNLCNSMEVNI